MIFLGFGAQLGLKNQRPEGTAALGDNGGGSGVGGQPAVPGAHQVGGLAEAVVGAGGVVDGVGKAMAQLLIHFAVNVGLHGEHIGGGKPVAAFEGFVDAFDAVGLDPFERKPVGRRGGGDTGVGGGQKTGGRIDGAGHRIEGDEALPLMRSVLNRRTGKPRGTQR